MSKIKEIVTIKSGMASYVDLHSELFDVDRCSKRMASYKPIRSHRTVFEQVAKALDPMDRRCYFLTGSYGTGKSHLCLMLANYFMYQSDVPEIEEFFSSYAEEDSNQANVLSKKRASGRYLVVVPQFGGNGTFEELVLRAIDEALKREEFDEELDSHYQEAARRLERWEEKDRSGTGKVAFYKLFSEELRTNFPDWTINKIKKGLREDFDREALQVFQEIHQSITDNEFTYSKDNLVEIIKGINRSEKFRNRFKGIVVIYDEFGYLLQEGRLGLNTFHAFSQLCAQGDKDWKGNNLVFIGTAHKPFSSYAKTTTAVDLSTLSDRIDEIALQTEGMEDIIAAIVTPAKENEAWQNQVAPKEGMFNQFAKECKRLALFDWLPAPRLREKIIEDLYPMHPMATYCLLRLANEIGSKNRSVYTFFSGELGPRECSYPWFVEKTDVLDEDGWLNLYTTDYLFGYFQQALFSTNNELREPIKEHLKNYEATVKELNKYVNQENKDKLFDQEDELMDRILRVMLVHEIASINNRKQNIHFSLNCTPQEQQQVDTRLKHFSQAKILYFNKINDVYEFRRSDMLDIDKMLDEFRLDETNIPKDIVEAMEKFVPLSGQNQYVPANNYNQAYNEDKRLLRVFCQPNQLSATGGGKEGSYFENRENELDSETNFKKSYEGIAVHMVCEDKESINRIHGVVSNNPSKRIAVAIPKEPIPVVDALLNVMAVENIKKTEKIEDFSAQDRALINEREKEFKKDLTRQREKYLSAKNVQWYGHSGKAIPVDPQKDYDIANKLIEPLFHAKSNKFQHDEFNKIHEIKFGPSKNQRLKEAIEKVLNHHEPILIDTEYAQNRGEIRYLRKCLLNQGALKQIDKKGTKLYCEPESDTQKYRSTLPALASMIEEIEGMESGKHLNINSFIRKYIRDYGQGYVAISLMFSVVYRYFRDNIRIKRDETTIGDMALIQFDDIYDLITGKYPNAYLEHREIHDSERRFINDLHRVFSHENLGTGQDATIRNVYELMKGWWNNLVPVVKTKDIYEQSGGKIDKFIDVFEKLESKDKYSFVLGDIQTIYGYESDELINDEIRNQLIEVIKKDKGTVESCEKKLESRILEGIRQIFGIEGSTYDDIRQGIGEWFNSLDDYQKDPMSDFHTPESRTIISELGSVTDIDETFFDSLPEASGFGLSRISEWQTNKTDDYIAKIKKGKKTVEENELRVENAEHELEGHYSEQKDGTLLYSGKLKIFLKHKDPNMTIFVAIGADPRSPDSERKKVVGTYEKAFDRNLTLKYVSQDSEGNFSRVHSISIVNEDKKYEITTPAQLTIGREPQVDFYFPSSMDKLSVTLKTLLRTAVEMKIIDRERVPEEIERILREFMEE